MGSEMCIRDRYNGEVTKANGDGSYEVTYDDGEVKILSRDEVMRDHGYYNTKQVGPAPHTLEAAAVADQRQPSSSSSNGLGAPAPQQTASAAPAPTKTPTLASGAGAGASADAAASCADAGAPPQPQPQPHPQPLVQQPNTSGDGAMVSDV